ncbi:hypothetical protein GGQ84_001256 [Desulfitispora alkaliphila]
MIHMDGGIITILVVCVVGLAAMIAFAMKTSK